MADVTPGPQLFDASTPMVDDVLDDVLPLDPMSKMDLPNSEHDFFDLMIAPADDVLGDCPSGFGRDLSAELGPCILGEHFPLPLDESPSSNTRKSPLGNASVCVADFFASSPTSSPPQQAKPRQLTSPPRVSMTPCCVPPVTPMCSTPASCMSPSSSNPWTVLGSPPAAWCDNDVDLAQDMLLSLPQSPLPSATAGVAPFKQGLFASLDFDQALVGDSVVLGAIPFLPSPRVVLEHVDHLPQDEDSDVLAESSEDDESELQEGEEDASGEEEEARQEVKRQKPDVRWEDLPISVTKRVYSKEERAQKVLRYLEKRARRSFKKKLLFPRRRCFAGTRPRVGGRFVSLDKLPESERKQYVDAQRAFKEQEQLDVAEEKKSQKKRKVHKRRKVAVK